MRLIDADELKHEICNIPMCGEHEQFYAIVSEVVKVLIAAPTIDPARHAHWKATFAGMAICSACDEDQEVETFVGNAVQKYCARCGARMDAEALSKMETTTEEEKDG